MEESEQDSGAKPVGSAERQKSGSGGGRGRKMETPYLLLGWREPASHFALSSPHRVPLGVRAQVRPCPSSAPAPSLLPACCSLLVSSQSYPLLPCSFPNTMFT